VRAGAGATDWKPTVCYTEAMDTDADIPRERQAEYSALVRLLMEHAAPDDDLAPGVADRISRAAMRPGHLWRAMELQDRGELRALFERHFPTLAAGNTKDMRWKKYLYKLMCGWPGFEG
jgi:nitrogen fixation protein NifQ